MKTWTKERLIMLWGRWTPDKRNEYEQVLERYKRSHPGHAPYEAATAAARTVTGITEDDEREVQRVIDIFGGEVASVEERLADQPRRKEAIGGLGILTDEDIEELGHQCQQVYWLMSDMRWHLAPEIRWAAGDGLREASEGLRRMRELRRWYDIERDCTKDRVWRYRLTRKK